MKKLMVFLLGLVAGLQGMAQVVSGPWVSEARENRVTILWTTEKAGQAYVELADGTKVWETFAGRRVFKRFHTVRIDGLEPGAVLRYRVGGIDLVDDRNARDPKFGEQWEGEWHGVRSFDPNAEACNFSVFNDVHMKTGKYSNLASQVDSVATSFLFLNGDITSAGNYVIDTLARYQIDPLGALPAGIPVLFARGNHEGRGNRPDLVADLYPNEDPAPFYYTFRQGPVAFIVLDAGETHGDRSTAYCGTEVFEEYLFAQLAWAKKAMKQKSFRRAPVKICLIHVPMIDHPDKDDYLIQRWLNVHFVPLLNQAGIDLMIGADLHEFMYCEPGTMGNDFPILVNDDVRRLDVRCERKKISLRMLNADGEEEFSKEIQL